MSKRSSATATPVMAKKLKLDLDDVSTSIPGTYPMYVIGPVTQLRIIMDAVYAIVK